VVNETFRTGRVFLEEKEVPLYRAKRERVESGGVRFTLPV